MSLAPQPRFARTALIALSLFSTGFAAAGEHERATLILTSTNDSTANSVVVFKLEPGESPSLSLLSTVPTGGQGGASGNAGIVQFLGDAGAVANFGSNSVTRLAREGDYIGAAGTIPLASGCVKPDSVALSEQHLFIVGATCAETHAWPAGHVDGPVVAMTSPASAQIAVGKTWAAVTQTSGSVLQLPLGADGALNGTVTPLTLPATANNTPLGEAFWANVLGFTPAHSPDSFAVATETGVVSPVTGPTPPYPTNAPCWLAKGPGNLWYAGNSPGHAISIFFSDSKGGAFYKSVPLPGVATDITVSPDKKWLAVLYSANSEGFVAVYAIDRYGDLTFAAASPSVGVAGFSGVAISQ
jgi:hypothetical protein